jgi:hypothetical protein
MAKTAAKKFLVGDVVGPPKDGVGDTPSIRKYDKDKVFHAISPDYRMTVVDPKPYAKDARWIRVSPGGEAGAAPRTDAVFDVHRDDIETKPKA